ncbi:MAG: class B sortase [Coriobacteriia bacterium]|nr:class B sortase [Coriobacteriia bacterium]
MSKHKKIRRPLPRERKVFIAICIVLALIVLAVAGYLIYKNFDNQAKYKTDPDIIFNQKVAGYDFNKLRQTYPDIVAWLDVPNTNIALPIVQHPDNDFYYLNHNAQSEYDVSGAAYMQLCNKKDMSDPVTVVYGHNMIDNGMFSTAHFFENSDFFKDNEKFYVYTPGHKLTYTTVSAYIYDDRHIINSNNGFTDTNVRMKYFNEVCNPTSQVKNVRPGISLKAEDKLFQLSTCMSDPNLANQRYIVSGVLTNDEPTN